MRYGIFSDCHSNLQALQAVTEAYKKESIDKFLCAGDTVGYATDFKETIDTVKSLCMVTVAGNHDWAAVGKFALEYFNPYALEALVWTRKKLDEGSINFLSSLSLSYKNEDLTLVHGTLDNPQDFDYMTNGFVAEATFRILETVICFVGHTHIAGFFIKDKNGKLYYSKDYIMEINSDKKYIVNVGSVGQPRDRDTRASYCIYDTDEKKVYLNRIDYDIEAVQKKIERAHLPRFLSERLSLGR